ncbi:hypothetical protein H1230_20605 [Paenibacillus sp. 19GGS1-52]|uniref:hypothetical protein n=1 Tax=Paenibacillus sp. 19GGS1-52 TaxID=2758563 RepID=UPI001EFB4FF9|nr:hypothetical protein [Paenibacillus sp. 19GGS1-52]ULO05472.1 hypothetical protein H1230_20605 [Paenibacillus sp. 19GGS1-52]
MKADFTACIARKRLYVQEHWPHKLTADVRGHWYGTYTGEWEEFSASPDWEPEDTTKEWVQEDWTWLPAQKGMTDSEAAAVVERALRILYPTGNLFLYCSQYANRN